MIKDFGVATRRTIEAGFDGVELHGANGYLLQRFVSPHSNKRTDEFQNRYLFTIKLIDEVKRVIKEYATKPFLIGYRFSPGTHIIYYNPKTTQTLSVEGFSWFFIDELITITRLNVKSSNRSSYTLMIFYNFN